jgi:hypothetical protein
MREQSKELQIAFAALRDSTIEIADLARERYPQYFAGPADGRTLITLLLDDEGQVTASDLVNWPSRWFSRNSEVEPLRYQRAFEFLASQGVPPEQARASTSFRWGTPPGGAFFVSPPSTRPELAFAVYDPAQRVTQRPVFPQMGASPEAIRAIITRLLPDLDENPPSGDTHEWFWALMDSRGDLLKAGREPEPAENARERARILESRYPGIAISDPPMEVNLRDRDGSFLVAHGDQLMLMVYWLDPGSPLP